MTVLLAAASAIDMNMMGIMNSALIKWAMNGVIMLSLIPVISAGARRNFGVSIDLSTGFVDMISSVNTRYTSWAGFFYSVFLGMIVALLFGYLYAKILNRLKLDEKIVGTLTGYSFTPIANLSCTFAPVTNRQILYPIGGQGLRPEVNLGPYFGQVLDRLWQMRIEEPVIPTGLLLFFFGTGFLLRLFLKTRAGVIFSTIAENERFVRLVGINVNGCRTAAIIMSTAIAAAEVVVYSQSYGILHLYDGLFMMSFPAASAAVIGSVNSRKATVANALIGTFLYQATYLLSTPMANTLLIPEMTEVMRTIITNGIILYTFMSERKDMRDEAH